MRTALKTIVAASLVILMTGASAFGAARLKDIARVAGVRENQLFGYGLVVGLVGSGDGVRMTKQMMANMYERFGIDVQANDINAKNVAAVMVTATLPAFAKPGGTIDVVVSSVGDAISIQGGTLLQTPLKGADGNVYAVAQGPLSLGGWQATGGGGARKSKGQPTVGRIADGGIVERAVPTELIGPDDKVYISLNNPDFTTASNASSAINKRFGSGTAKAVDSSTIEINVPANSTGDLVPFLSDVESLQVEQDLVSKVVINEKTGTIVMGGDVSISPVAIAHGTLTVTVKPEYNIVQPGTPFAGGSTVAYQSSQPQVEEQKVAFTRVSTSDLVDALNAMGVTPSDIIAILQALKVSGALQADLVLM
jgi:flagellar P-ring protein FlgI